MLVQQVGESCIKPEALRLVVAVHLDFMCNVQIGLCVPGRATGIRSAHARNQVGGWVAVAGHVGPLAAAKEVRAFEWAAACYAYVSKRAYRATLVGNLEEAQGCCVSLRPPRQRVIQVSLQSAWAIRRQRPVTRLPTGSEVVNRLVEGSAPGSGGGSAYCHLALGR